MSIKLPNKQSDIITNFFPYINKEYLNDYLNQFYTKIFGSKPNDMINLSSDDKLNKYLEYFNFDIKKVYSDKEFIAINYLRILSETNIEDAKLRYIIYYVACFNAQQPNYTVFNFNNNFYITISSQRPSGNMSLKKDNINLTTLQLPEHFQYYLERCDHYMKLKEDYLDRVNSQVSTKADTPSVNINTRSKLLYLIDKYPLIAKLDMSFIFDPIINNTFSNLMNELKTDNNSNNIITLLFCEYVVTQYIKNNKNKHINYIYTSTLQTTGVTTTGVTTSGLTTSGVTTLNMQLKYLGDLIRTWVNTIILPTYYTTNLLFNTMYALPNKDTVINNNIIDIYLRSNLNFIKKDIIDILKKTYNESFIYNLYAILYHRSSGLYLKKQLDNKITASEDEYNFVTKNILTDNSKKWGSNLYNLNNNIEPGGMNSGENISRYDPVNNLDPYYFYLKTSGRNYNQRENYYIEIINKIVECNQVFNEINNTDLSQNYKRAYSMDLLKIYLSTINLLLLSLINILYINNIKINTDIYSKISTLNMYFKLSYDDFYILYREFDKLSVTKEQYDRMHTLLFEIANFNIQDIVMFRTHGLDFIYKDYNYFPIEAEYRGAFEDNPRSYLGNITDGLTRYVCQMSWSKPESNDKYKGAAAILGCIGVLPYILFPYKRRYPSKYERETSLIS